MVVHHLGGQLGAAVPSADLSSGDLSALADSRHRAGHRHRGAHAARFLAAKLVGRTLVELGEGIPQPHADRAARLQDDEQIFETLFSKSGSSFRKVALVEFPAPGMWSIVFISQQPGATHRGAPAGDRQRLGVFYPVRRTDYRFSSFSCRATS